MDLYFHSPIRLHGKVLNKLSTETILIFFYSFKIATLALGFNVEGMLMDLRRADPPSKEYYQLCKKIKKQKKRPRSQQRAVEP
jgi:hypothetical protein